MENIKKAIVQEIQITEVVVYSDDIYWINYCKEHGHDPMDLASNIMLKFLRESYDWSQEYDKSKNYTAAIIKPAL